MSEDYDDDVMESDCSEAEISASNIHMVDAAEQAARDRAREELAADVEAFLAQGGTIQQIAVNVMADPPKRPQSNYGGQPI